MAKKKNYLVVSIVSVLLVGLGVGNKREVDKVFSRFTAEISEPLQKGRKKKAESVPIVVSGDKKDQYNQLATLDFQSGSEAVINVNEGRSTLDITSWETNRVVYGDLDELNRTTVVTAYINKKNLGRSEGRERQVWKPTGWHQKKVDGETIINRGHLLAYTSSFSFDIDGNYKEGESGSEDNPKNLATQTAFANQKVQTYYEKLVRDAQKINGNKIVYEIVTVFRDQELMPRGYWLQAIDSAGTINFNVYEYNVQPNVVFNYSDGTSNVDRTMTVAWTKSDEI